MVTEVRTLMLDNGAKVAMMSGSGPSVFGVFDNIETARDSVELIKSQGYFAVVAFPTAKRIL